MKQIGRTLEELKKYTGISPCPVDIDDFWNEQIKKLDNINNNLDIRKANINIKDIECYECYFTGIEGAKIYFKYLHKKNCENQKVMLSFHGYGCSGANFASSLLAYVYAGYSVAIMDCRGQGGKSEDVGGVSGNTQNGLIYRGSTEWNPEKLYFRNVFLDTYQLANIITSFPENSNDVTTIGFSQGGGLSLVCASLVSNVSKCISGYPFLSDYKYAWQNGDSNLAFAEFRNYFRWFDPTHKKEDEFFNLLGYIDIQNLVHRIKGDVLMLTGLEDVVVSPDTQFAAYNKIISKKEIEIFHDYGHEFLNSSDDIIYKWLIKD